MDKKVIISKVIEKLSNQVTDNANTFIRKNKTDGGYSWEVGFNLEEMYQFDNEEEALKKLEELKKKKENK